MIHPHAPSSIPLRTDPQEAIMDTSASPRWSHRPEPSTWGDFGADDALGRMNLLTPDKVMQGLAEVKEGRTFSLGLPLTCLLYTSPSPRD